MFKLKSLPLVGTLISAAEFVVGIGVAATGRVEPTFTPAAPDPLDPVPLDAVAALRTEREAHEQTKAALTDSEARRRELEAMLNPPLFSKESGLAAQQALLDQALREATGFPEALLDPEGEVSIALIAPLLEQMSDLLTHAIERASMLHRALDRDRSGLAAALARVVEEARGRYWIAEGRGSYAWNDDRYRREAGQGYAAIAEVAASALSASGTIATQAIRDEPLGAEPEELTVAEAVSVFLADAAQRASLVESRWALIREHDKTLPPKHAHADPGLLAALDVAVVETLKAIWCLAAPTTGRRTPEEAQRWGAVTVEEIEHVMLDAAVEAHARGENAEARRKRIVQEVLENFVVVRPAGRQGVLRAPKA